MCGGENVFFGVFLIEGFEEVFEVEEGVWAAAAG